MYHVLNMYMSISPLTIMQFILSIDCILFSAPLEMGRQELYDDIPFLAVPGLQKKEHSLSVAFSSYAA